MNLINQQIVIAKACGWTPHPDIDCRWQFPGDLPNEWTDEEDLPDYLNDLNAMHEAEATLTQSQLWYMTTMLAEIVDADIPIAHATATAAQRAEAFLKTLGLWEPTIT